MKHVVKHVSPRRKIFGNWGKEKGRVEGSTVPGAPSYKSNSSLFCVIPPPSQHQSSFFFPVLYRRENLFLKAFIVLAIIGATFLTCGLRES